MSSGQKTALVAAVLSITVLTPIKNASASWSSPTLSQPYSNACSGSGHIANPTDTVIDHTLDRYSQLGIMFYDPCAKQQTQNTVYENIHNNLANQNGGGLLWIGGNNVSLASTKIQQLTQIEEDSIYAKENLSLSSADGAAAIDAIDDIIEKDGLESTVIISLDSYDELPDEIIEQKIKEIVTKLASGRTLILATSYSPDGKEKTANAKIRKLAEKWSNVLIADWEDFANNSLRKNELYEDDGKTLTNYGKEQWIKVIYASIPGNSSYQSNQSNEALIWNYFAESEESPLARDQAAIAGIIANTDALSGSNPFYRDPVTQKIGLFAQKDQKLEELLSQASLNIWNTDASFALREKAIKLELDYYTSKQYQTEISKALKTYISSYQSKRTDLPEYRNAQFYTRYLSSLLHLKINKNMAPNYLSSLKHDTSESEIFSVAHYAYSYFSGTKPNTINNAELASQTKNPVNNMADEYPIWNHGWITGGFIGYYQQKPEDVGFKLKDASFALPYSTSINNKKAANKITLFTTEKIIENPTSILDYYKEDGNLPHFTIDIENHKIYQHLSIDNPATMLPKHNREAGIQVSIIGKTSDIAGGLADKKYTDEDWAYLGRALYVLSAQIGIDASKSGIINTVGINEDAYKNSQNIFYENQLPFYESDSYISNLNDKITKAVSDCASIYGEIQINES